MKEELKKQVLGNVTGRKISLPQWASFILFAAQIIRYPVFYLGAIGLMAVTYALLHKQENLLHICAISVALTLVWLVVIVFKSASDMGKEGMLVYYMSALASDTRLGRWLVVHFGT